MRAVASGKWLVSSALRKIGVGVLLALATLITSVGSHAQSTGATVTGEITDQTGKVVPGVAVAFTNINTGAPYTTKTNGSGIYVLATLQPGIYRANVSKDGFKGVVKPDIELHVQDQVSINFSLQLGSVSETITVESGAPVMDTESAAVSTIVDKNFVESIPLNGRSLQPLISLTPGVVLTPATYNEQGQFSVNGQRDDANYFMIDGVSANFGAGSGSGSSSAQAFAGAIPALNATGGTNSLVSIDAVQEFRIETSSYAPEFGRSPGGQISIATRSGTGQFHGDVFDYFRNDVLDANDWFADANHLPKAPERQNDFGGVVGGPILKDRTFFFFSYEGLRLLQPETGIETVPDVAFRQSVPSALQPLLNAYPIPNGKDFGDGTAEFARSISNPTTLDATSIRIDHRLNSKITIFGRYDYAPSKTGRIPTCCFNLVYDSDFPVQTVTLGSTQSLRSTVSNDIRFNYSRADNKGTVTTNSVGGAVPPPQSLLFPSALTAQNSNFAFGIQGLGGIAIGNTGSTSQRQFNLVDGLTVSRGTHQLKFGVDYRRLASTAGNVGYQQIEFNGLTGSGGVNSGTVPYYDVRGAEPLTLIFQNISVYGQDAWKLGPRVTLTYGLRWEVNPPLHGASGVPVYTAENLNDPANLSLAPAGTPFYKTDYHEFAPRVGVAIQVSNRKGLETVMRGGVGIFYDLGAGTLGNGSGYFPYFQENVLSGISFPISASNATPPPFSATIPPGGITQIEVANPNLTLPRTYQWNVALEQSLGSNQTFSITYVGAAGRDLLRQNEINFPNPDFRFVYVTTNAAQSNYNALQVKYQRRLSHGLEALGFYSLSHCIDDASNESSAFSNDPNADRGNCDFDIRHSAHGVITYNIPTPPIGTFGKAILRGWAVDTIGVGQSAPPLDLQSSVFIASPKAAEAARPDVEPGIPLYLYGAQCAAANGGIPCPGGKTLNFTPGAVVGGCPDGTPSAGPFCDPPVNASGHAARQGDLGRNSLRGFGLWQVDLALRRQFDITERFNLQFSAEAFNVLNHPNFGNVDTCTCDSPGTFGQSTATLASSLGSPGGIGFNPLYQVGGPRSIQLAMKLKF